MDNLENLKNEIKIPTSVEVAVKKGIERGRKEKRVKKLQKTYKKIAATVAIVVVTAGAGIINPSIVRAIPGIKSIFKLVGYGNMGENFEKFEQFSNSVNKSVKKNGIEITINEIIIDDNMLAITSFIEGSNLNEDRGYMGSIKLNGNLLRSRSDKGKKVDDNEIMMVTYANVSDLDLADDIEVDLNIVWVGEVKGPWNFKFKVYKTDMPTNSKVTNLDKSIQIPNSTLKLEKLIVSPLGNTLTYSGLYAEGNESTRNGIFNFLVMDEKGRILETKAGGVSSNKEKYDGKIEILNNLSNVKALTVVPVLKEWGFKIMNIDDFPYPVLQTTVNSRDFNTPQETITKSRPVTEKEKADGYALNNVTHVFNIDRVREFSTIDKLINQTIKVGESNTVLVKNIEASDKETKITFKIEGNGSYSYMSINSVVILDENYNDNTRAEDGDIAVLENIDERLISIKLPPIDKAKKYKICLPIIEQPQVEEKYKINVDLVK
jgi:hypothetical protein